MGRQHAHDGDARARQRAARDGQSEREGARAGHDRAAVPDRVHPVEREQPCEASGVLLGRRPAEVVADRRRGRGVLVQVARGAHAKRHAPILCGGYVQTFSSGAYSSISRRSLPSAANRTVTTPSGSIRVTTPSPSEPWRTESPVESAGTACSSRGMI